MEANHPRTFGGGDLAAMFRVRKSRNGQGITHTGARRCHVVQSPHCWLVGAVVCISSDTTGATAQVTVVEFVYQASTSIDPDVAAAHTACVAGVGQTHIHPSWLNFSRINMRAVGVERWEITFEDVPINVFVRTIT